MSNPRQPAHPIDPLFTERWSPRAFTEEGMPQATLMSLLEAARWAPSAYNVQPWRFIYAHRDTPAWQPIFGSLVEFNQMWTKRAAALVVIASAREAVFPGAAAPAPNASHAFDAGAAWASLAFQAQLSGWSAHAMAGFDAAKLRAAIGLPEAYAIDTVVAVGRKGDPAVLPEGIRGRELPSDRRPLSQTAFEGSMR
ncbi:nitroreductase family protein [uncultured Pseudacidovorax sp.]|uniref:nitroreductase family protein n=1 Tax=uncultured Pseudacidovorax sp. TaxID=679313 RepID=UPI0025DB1721|nr:nitroreductase family protein [uncultured Pseudacidovorax sp.]